MSGFNFTQWYCLRMSNYKHGASGTRLHSIWKGMRKRCSPSGPANYAGRGIAVCEEWVDFASFRDWALANGYEDGLSIERVDNNGDYSPDNCCWATPAVQARNKSNTLRVSAFGTTRTLVEWADDPRCVVTYSVLHHRVVRDGWKLSRAMRTPRVDKTAARSSSQTLMLTALGERKSLRDWATDPRCSVAYHTLRNRVRCGWSADAAVTKPSRLVGC